METTTSVSKGIFVRKRKVPNKNDGGKRRMSRKQKQSVSPWAGQPWYLTYTRTWEKVEQQIKELNENMFSKLQKDVSSYLKLQIRDSRSSSFEIPTATILTGINVPDHSVLFSSLEQELLAEVSPHVALLSARNCGKVRGMVGHVLQQCRDKDTSQIHEIMDDEVEEEEEDSEGVVRGKRAAQCTFSVLAKWYLDQHAEEDDEPRPPVIVVLCDFESFSPRVLEDFIYIASEYRETVPLALVMGVATRESTAHSHLPHHIISRLKMRVFFTQGSNALLHQLLDEVILSPNCHFRLGGKVFGMLTDNFLYYDFSVTSFLQKLKVGVISWSPPSVLTEAVQFCMLEHFLGHGLSLDPDHVEDLDAEQLEVVRRLPSFKQYVQRQMPAMKKNLLTNDGVLKETVELLRCHFIEHFELFFIGLRCLKELVKDLPESAIGRQIGDIYFRAVSEPIWESEDYKNCQNFWRNVSSDGLNVHLTNIMAILEGAPASIQEKWLPILERAQKNILDLQNVREDCPSPSKNAVLSIKAKSREELQKHLRQQAHSAPVLNRFERLREEVLGLLSEMLTGSEEERGLLFPPGQLELHELLMFDRREEVRDQLIGHARSALNRALANPQQFLQCECCAMEDVDDVLASLPDVSIAYKLHLECGRHINLFDWLQSFNAVVNPDQENQEQPQEVDIHTQSRFTQAVAELQFLGFVKPTTRKADHMVRLTFGYAK